MKKFKILLPIILTLISLLVSFLPTHIYADGEAWLTDYSYRKQITVTGGTDGAKTDYQIPIHIYRSSGSDGSETIDGVSGYKLYVSTNCLITYNDIRFTTSDGETLLYYWISSSDSSSAIVWVEFNSTPASGSTTNFYMYYGNAGASSASDGANTFILFDDMERGNNGDAIGGSWTVASGSVVISTDHAYGGTRSAKIAGNNPASNSNIPQSSTSNAYAIRVRVWKENANGDFYPIMHGNGTKRERIAVDTSENVIYTNAAGTAVDTGSNITADAWQLFEVTNLDFTAGTFDIWLNGSKISDNVQMNTSTSMDNIIYIGSSETTSGEDAYFDNLIVRNWTANPPTITASGSEEEPSSGEPTVTTSAATSVTMDKDGVTGGTFNGNLTDLGDDTDVDVSFIYGTTSACSDGETTPENLDATGTFDNSLEFPDDWTPGETYYYKAKAVNAHGTSYGSVQSIIFTMPTITTQAATYTSPGAATANLNGNISNMGVATGCYAYFEYGTSTSYGSTTTPQTFTIADDVEDTISGFLHNATIHYRLVIEVGETTVNGNDETFLIAPNALAQVLWYQPIDIIHQVEGDWILPDRASTEDGIITWGTNPEGITSSTGVLLSTGSIGASTKGQHDTAPAIGTDMTGIDEEQDDFILISIFKPIAELTDYPLWFLFLLLGLACTVIAMMYVQKHLQNQLFTSAAGLIVIFIFYKLGIFDWWMFFVPVIFFMSIIVMERKPSL